MTVLNESDFHTSFSWRIQSCAKLCIRILKRKHSFVSLHALSFLMIVIIAKETKIYLDSADDQLSSSLLILWIVLDLFMYFTPNLCF